MEKESVKVKKKPRVGHPKHIASSFEQLQNFGPNSLLQHSPTNQTLTPKAEKFKFQPPPCH
jgi:hypothetical protein